MSAAFDRAATVTASVKRAPAISSGLRGAALLIIPALSCTPLDPVSGATAARLKLEPPFRQLETYSDSPYDDIRPGDILIVGNEDYSISAADRYDWRLSKTWHLVVELRKAARA